MQDDIRANLMRDLYKQIPKATNKDLASAIEYLKSAIEIRSGKSQKRRDARKKYKKKQIEAADFPFWWQSSTREIIQMALKHGNKSYYQVLIDPNRSELIEEQAEKEGIRGTAWVRKVAYKELERIYPSTTYKVAEAKDELMWRESVERRIQGRKSKQ